ncbi:MAG TPA: membrane protein insertion efficiency factor YidD [Candidatus Babeliales bacterium]|nr:membrane protein insertion efficiency factor YidD [Candidatus Babeliales bacterium]
MLKYIKNIPKHLLITCITLLRPILGPAVCRFEETCTPYTIRQLREQNIFRAIWNSTKRLLSCSPLTRL